MPIDIDKSFYDTGTATVSQGGTTVTGQGTAWLQSVRPGDLFGTHKGYGVRIVSVDSNTSLTLAHQWPGPSQTAQPYEIQFTPYDVGYQQAVRELLQALASGNVEAFAALTGSANKLPYFTGPGAVDLADLTPGARAVLALTGAAGKIPVFTGNDSAAARDIVGTVSQSGGIPTGAIIERGSNANGEYVRFADGTQICWRDGATATMTATTTLLFNWTLPASFSDDKYMSHFVLQTQNFSGDKRQGLLMERTTDKTKSYTQVGFLGPGFWVAEDAATGTAFATGRWF